MLQVKAQIAAARQDLRVLQSSAAETEKVLKVKEQELAAVQLHLGQGVEAELDEKERGEKARMEAQAAREESARGRGTELKKAANPWRPHGADGGQSRQWDRGKKGGRWKR